MSAIGKIALPPFGSGRKRRNKVPAKRGLSPTQRTLRALRDQGQVCAIVERFNQYAGPFGRREDLFGIIDVLALDPERGVVGIQCCGSDFKAHKDKILIEKAQETHDWLSTKVHCPYCGHWSSATSLEVWSWRKVKLKRGGKAMRWKAKVEEIKMEDFENA